MKDFFKSSLYKAYMKLPLWGKVAVPAVIVMVAVSLLSALGTIIKIGLVAAVIFGGITLFNQVKKKG